MKKKDIINLVKESVEEIRSFYGVHDTYGASPRQTRNLSGYPGVMEFEQPKSFDPDTINLVREMLEAADIYHNDLVDSYDEVSSFLGKRSGGTYFKFPHYNGPGGRGALMSRGTVDRIDREKAKAKAAALKTYTKFKTYIEDYEITDKSPAGVYGNVYLFVMFNDLAKDYSAPKGGTQSSQFEDLKEFTDYGQEGIYPKKEKPGDMFQQKEVEDLFPNGMASRSDKAFQARVKQHADWTEQSAYNNTFVHMQYHETKGLEDEYFIYQTQHYNTNYNDFRSPKFTMLSITKNKGTEKEEDLGQYIVDTKAYIEDLNTLENRGVLGKRVMESPMFRTGVKMDMAPKVMAPRIKKVFDLVNGAKHPVRTPEFHKNRFKDKYGISFPETLKGITKDQALAMNKYANDMKNMIKEETYYGKGAMDDMMKDPAFGALTGDAKEQAKKDLAAGNSVSLEELELTNDVGKDDYVDDEGRMAKSQLYKMGKYAVKLHRMLDDMEQLPAWLQAKITKASDYMSMVYHYLDYEFARRDGNLMEEVDKYKEEMLKELTEEPNEGNAFAVARLKAIKAGDKKFKVGDKEFDVTDVSDDDKKAAEEI